MRWFHSWAGVRSHEEIRELEFCYLGSEGERKFCIPNFLAGITVITNRNQN